MGVAKLQRRMEKRKRHATVKTIFAMEVKLLNSAINHCFFVLLLLLSFQDSPRLHLVIITDLMNKRISRYDYSNIGYTLNLFICEYATICQNGFCDKVTIQLF